MSRLTHIKFIFILLICLNQASYAIASGIEGLTTQELKNLSKGGTASLDGKSLRLLTKNDACDMSDMCDKGRNNLADTNKAGLAYALIHKNEKWEGVDWSDYLYFPNYSKDKPKIICYTSENSYPAKIIFLIEAC